MGAGTRAELDRGGQMKDDNELASTIFGVILVIAVVVLAEMAGVLR